MATWHPFNATGEKDTCLWCGRKLRQKYHTETERTDKTRPPTRCYSCAGLPGPDRFIPTDDPKYFQCARCGTETQAEFRRRVVSREKWLDGRGDYGDGFFCGLRCAYEFAVRAAQTGTRLVRNKRSA